MNISTPDQADELDKILKVLNIQRGGVPGISGDAPANNSYYLACEHMDYGTEEETQHLTNVDGEVAAIKDAILAYTARQVKEAEDATAEWFSEGVPPGFTKEQWLVVMRTE